MNNRTPQWRTMDAATRAQAYSPSSVLDGPIDPFIQAYVDKSAAAYAAFENVQTIKYGFKSSNSIDLLMPSGSKLAPLHIFIHGGYWQLLSKRDSFFPAPDTLKRGMGFAAIDYTLAPDASLDDIVSECCDAIECLHDNAAQLGYDPSAFILSGSSAGAHLAAMCCLKLPAIRRPKGLALLSGIYELEPLIGTYINDAVGMDVDVAKRNSPMRANLSGFPNTVIAWGAQETDEFKRQSNQFADHLIQADATVTRLEAPERNHFDIVMDLVNDTELGCALADLVSN
ncbi:alpha/beta hydrolase fold domain-containing protein [Pseudosulfitobacter sp. SM2401]|uniref:alpha/beta hydrolase n=1 Tax=Pseudosulfitobacter sp. SM2401 TaxID=3350098 RepID=UPI0036F44BF4